MENLFKRNKQIALQKLALDAQFEVRQENIIRGIDKTVNTLRRQYNNLLDSKRVYSTEEFKKIEPIYLRELEDILERLEYWEEITPEEVGITLTIMKATVDEGINYLADEVETLAECGPQIWLVLSYAHREMHYFIDFFEHSNNVWANALFEIHPHVVESNLGNNNLGNNNKVVEDKGASI